MTLHKNGQKKALRSAPTVDRFDATASKTGSARVDREGGRYGAGLISGISLCSRGEALGHYLWIDDVMLQQIVDLSPSAEPKLLKSRFTHPDLCSDGMGKGLGVIDNLTKQGDQVYGDLHFYEVAHRAPDGDLAGYVMDLAEQDPVNFGLSIVFAHDWESEDEFEDEHTETIELKDDKGNVVSTRRQFRSPDPDNVENLPHARIAEMRAADVVDEPAANPNGLFHRENALLADGGKLMEFVLGRSAEVPKLASSLGADVAPERLKSFVSKFLAKAGLSVVAKETDMKKTGLAEDPKGEKKKEDAPPPAEKKTDGPAADDETNSSDKEDGCDKGDEEDDSADDKSKEKTSSQSAAGATPNAPLSKYCEVFGHEQGAKYFLDGVQFEEAQSKEIVRLRTDLAEKDKTLEAFAKSGVAPVKFNASDSKKPGTAGTTSAAEGEVDNRAMFAAMNAATIEPQPKK